MATAIGTSVRELLAGRSKPGDAVRVRESLNEISAGP
jgi:hypothetical protein